MSKNADLKAIGWYATANNLKPEMSVWPTIEFTNRRTGEREKMPIENIKAQYERNKEAERKINARMRREL